MHNEHDTPQRTTTPVTATATTVTEAAAWIAGNAREAWDAWAERYVNPTHAFDDAVENAAEEFGLSTAARVEAAEAADKLLGLDWFYQRHTPAPDPVLAEDHSDAADEAHMRAEAAHRYCPHGVARDHTCGICSGDMPEPTPAPLPDPSCPHGVTPIEACQNCAQEWAAHLDAIEAAESDTDAAWDAMGFDSVHFDAPIRETPEAPATSVARLEASQGRLKAALAPLEATLATLTTYAAQRQVEEAAITAIWPQAHAEAPMCSHGAPRGQYCISCGHTVGSTPEADAAREAEAHERLIEAMKEAAVTRFAAAGLALPDDRGAAQRLMLAGLQLWQEATGDDESAAVASVRAWDRIPAPSLSPYAAAEIDAAWIAKVPAGLGRSPSRKGR